jgi:hypothetical protein
MDIKFDRDYLISLLVDASVHPDAAAALVARGSEIEDSERAYMESVDSMAREVLDAVRDEGADEHDALWERIDGSWWIIYTHAQIKVLSYSRNDDAMWEETGSGPVDCDSAGAVYTQLAFWAMRADVMEAIDRIRDEYETDDETDDEEEITNLQSRYEEASGNTVGTDGNIYDDSGNLVGKYSDGMAAMYLEASEE